MRTILTLLFGAATLLNAATPEYSIDAIRYATVKDFALNGLVMGAPAGEKIDIAMAVWLLRGGGHNVLFDSGFHRQKWIDQFHVSDFLSPAEAVKLAGVDPTQVTDIVISHAHWDHMGGIDLFPNATIWIQKAEYEYYTGAAWQPGGRKGGIDADDMVELLRRNLRGQVRLIAGDNVEFLPGLTAYTGARHTYASQYIRVAGVNPYVLASDNCYLYENLRSHRASATFEPADQPGNLAAQERMVTLAGTADRVVPGHDPAQFTRFAAEGRVAHIQKVPRPDGLYAEIDTSKGRIVARLEPDLAPLTVANFVGLAEGTIANAAFDPGRPFYDGTVYHRVVAGHVIQAGVPQSEKARGPGYAFPNEINAELSHNHAGAVQMANSGPNTNGSQFCVTLGDRSYLDGNFNVFGEVIEGMDVVMRIVQGDVIQKVRIARVGDQAASYRVTNDSFQGKLKTAEARVAEHLKKKEDAEQAWLARNYPKGAEQISPGTPAAAGTAMGARYRGTEVRYIGDVIGHQGPPLEVNSFASGENGAPVFEASPVPFPAATKTNPGLDAAIAAMAPGERRIVIVPPSLGYGRAGFYPPEVPGKKRRVISPFSMLVYEVELLP